MELLIKDINKNLVLSDSIFNIQFNKILIKQVINSYLCSLRQGTKAQKSRGEVKGSNKKPWKQKGTGRARAGTVKSPLWRTGGVTFAAKPRNYHQKINKKMYKLAVKGIFSELIRNNKLLLVSKLTIPQPKTKLFINSLNNLIQINQFKKITIIDQYLETNCLLASRNLKSWLYVFSLNKLNLIRLISSNIVMITTSAIKALESNLL